MINHCSCGRHRVGKAKLSIPVNHGEFLGWEIHTSTTCVTSTPLPKIQHGAIR